jgi:DNA-binding NarL/FixJ family response regulator
MGVVVMLAEQCECVHFVHELVRAGVCGCLDEFSSGADLVHCLKEVSAGRTCYCKSSTNLATEYYALETIGGRRGSTRVLSQREREVGGYLVCGVDTHTIAGLLDLTVSTVETYRKRLYRKAGVHKVAELCRWWQLNGMDAGLSPYCPETRPDDEKGGEK